MPYMKSQSADRLVRFQLILLFYLRDIRIRDTYFHTVLTGIYHSRPIPLFMCGQFDRLHREITVTGTLTSTVVNWY